MAIEEKKEKTLQRFLSCYTYFDKENNVRAHNVTIELLAM